MIAFFGLLQIIDNAYDKLEAAWEDNVYAGFGTVIHRVDHDTSETDFSPDSDHERNREFLEKSLVKAPSDMVDEFRLIMSHFSSGLYRWKFQRCQKRGCPVCPEPSPPQTPVELFYEKFGGEMPSPMPFWAAFPPKPGSSGASTGPGDRVITHVGQGSSGSEGLRYRSIMDFVKLNIPRKRMHGDQHYEGPTGRHVCTICSPEVCHRSGAALLRHMKMLHS